MSDRLRTLLKLTRLMALALAGSILIKAAFADTPDARLTQLVAQFKGQSTPAQFDQLQQAINASPRLRAQLAALIDSGQLAGFSIGPPDLSPQIFHAGIKGATTMTFTDGFLDAQKNNHLMDVIHQDELFPNNMVFVLGHLAYHLEHADDMGRAERDADERFKAQMAATPQGTPIDVTSQLQQAIPIKLHDEAAALIQGWNDVIDAARLDNGDRPLAVPQIGDLLLNLRYRAVFVSAFGAPVHPQLSGNGEIAPSQSNINAVAQTLGKMRVMDIQ